MPQQTSSTGTSSTTPDMLLEEVRQAMLHVEAIRDLNNQADVEAGHLIGMNQILKNAEKVLATARTAAWSKKDHKQ